MFSPHSRVRRYTVGSLTAVSLVASLTTPAFAAATTDTSPAPSASSTSSSAPLTGDSRHAGGGREDGTPSSEATAIPSTPAPDPDPEPTTQPTQTPEPATPAGTVTDPLMLDGTGSWVGSGSRWWWRKSDGSYPRAVWAQVAGTVYHFDAAGWMDTGWEVVDGSWHYFWASGAHATGWVRLNGTWYYLSPETGAMRTGWLQLGSTRYYLTASGAMATGWVRIDGSWYYFSGSGAVRTGWVKISGYWYYLDPKSGAMATGWRQVDKTWYHLSGSGSMDTGWLWSRGAWYYLTGSGAMATGWVSLDGVWYYLSPDSGAMVTGKATIDGKQESFAPNGEWRGYRVPGGYLQVTDKITSLGWSTNTLTSGMNGVKVRIVRRKLGLYDSSLATVNGAFMSAVRNFQRRAGLPQTGVVDEATWNAMGTGYSWYVDQYQATPISLESSRSERIEAMISYARDQIGSSYTWGGAGPYSLGFDCSGLVLQSLYHAGLDPQPINVVKHGWPSYRSSQELYAYSGFKHVPFSERRRGDLIFYRSGGTIVHVAIYLGGNRIVHTDWMDRPAREDYVTGRYSWSAIDSYVVRPFP